MTVVFTNGCFDILHAGHVDLLSRARALGDRLVVGINSDASVRTIKGVGRPFIPQDERREILLGLRFVDEVVIFEELTPENVIKQLKPDVLVKGGDWQLHEIIGADVVTTNGGEIYSLPLVEGLSTTALIEKMKGKTGSETKTTTDNSLAKASLIEHQVVISDVINNNIAEIEACAALLTATFRNKGKVLICGNGGSAADAQHIAAELVGRYEAERVALPAIALTTDTSSLTAITNDYDFERVFARQIEALANDGDVLIAISTSGNSPNVIAAVMSARAKGCKVIGFTGAAGKKLAGLSDVCLLVPSKRTARIQEAHITAAHVICELVESEFSGG